MAGANAAISEITDHHYIEESPQGSKSRCTFECAREDLPEQVFIMGLILGALRLLVKLVDDLTD